MKKLPLLLLTSLACCISGPVNATPEAAVSAVENGLYFRQREAGPGGTGGGAISR